MLRSLSVLPLSLAVLSLSCSAPPEPPPKAAPVVTPPKPTAEACAAPAAECDGDAKTACETDLRSSAAHCGACGKSCAGGESCVAGACRRTRTASASGGSVCAILSGAVACWGDNRGQIGGPGAPRYMPTPRRIEGTEGAISVVAGYLLSCALLPTGKLKCWGRDRVHDIDFGATVTSFAVDDDVVYGVLEDGSVKARDVLRGEGSEDAQLPPIKDVASIAASDSHACAVHTSGEVSCWGAPEQTGSGLEPSAYDDAAQREELEKKAHKVKGLADAVQVSVSRRHSCALRRTGQIVCWGDNDSGEAGVPDDTEHLDAPVLVPLLEDAVEVTAGEGHTCARRKSGKLLCWGRRRAGQLGGGLPLVTGLVEVKGIDDATGVAAGDEVSCATRAAGGASCWGIASHGRLGHGAMPHYPTPRLVAGVSGAVELALGMGYSCARDARGKIMCWGIPFDSSNYKVEDRGIPPKVFPTAGPVASMTAWLSNLCTVSREGEAECADRRHDEDAWKLGELGKVKTVYRRYPGSVALLTSGQVVLFSRVMDYKKNKAELKKKPLAALAGAVAVASAGDHVCAVKKSGKVACVGVHYRTFDAKDPVEPTPAIELPNVSDAADVSAGVFELLILHRTGEVSRLSTSDLPRAEEKKKGAPPPKKQAPKPIVIERVKGLSGVVKLAQSIHTRCALLKDGTVWCSGPNSDGEVGRGDFEYHIEPGPVPGLTDVVDVATGDGQTCAARKSGEVLCWGRNVADEAGQPAATYSFEPVSVQKPAP